MPKACVMFWQAHRQRVSPEESLPDRGESGTEIRAAGRSSLNLVRSSPCGSPRIPSSIPLNTATSDTSCHLDCRAARVGWRPVGPFAGLLHQPGSASYMPFSFLTEQILTDHPASCEGAAFPPLRMRLNTVHLHEAARAVGVSLCRGHRTTGHPRGGCRAKSGDAWHGAWTSIY